MASLYYVGEIMSSVGWAANRVPRLVTLPVLGVFSPTTASRSRSPFDGTPPAILYLDKYALLEPRYRTAPRTEAARSNQATKRTVNDCRPGGDSVEVPADGIIADYDWPHAATRDMATSLPRLLRTYVPRLPEERLDLPPGFQSRRCRLTDPSHGEVHNPGLIRSERKWPRRDRGP
jgi:hypothetical protein